MLVHAEPVGRSSADDRNVLDRLGFSPLGRRGMLAAIAGSTVGLAVLQYRLATSNMGAVLPGYVDTPEKRLNLAMPLTPV